MMSIVVNPLPDTTGEHRMKTHRQRHPTHDRVYYTGGDRPEAASEQIDADWITLEVSRFGATASMAFRYLADMESVLKVEAMLRYAYERGKDDARYEVRKALGLVE